MNDFTALELAAHLAAGFAVAAVILMVVLA